MKVRAYTKILEEDTTAIDNSVALEGLAIIKGLLGGSEVNFTGQHYRVTGHRIHPLPAQRPHPPIVVGGNGPRLLALAAKEADIVNFTGITFTRGGTVPDMSGWRPAGIGRRSHILPKPLCCSESLVNAGVRP